MLLTPALFLLHADHCGIYGHAGEATLLNTESDASPGHAGIGHRHSGSAHDPHDCMQCQAFLHYFSGVTLCHAQEIDASASPAHILGADAAAFPRGERFSSFLSRAPPAPSGSFRS